MATSGVASGARAVLKNPLTAARVWHLFDAAGHGLGRAANKAARLLIGKHKPIYDPAVDVGDYVVVVNAEKIDFGGAKWSKKVYQWHTGYPGGLKQLTAKQLLEKHPERLFEYAVESMVPRNRLRKPRMERLRIYAGPNHPHAAQINSSPTQVPSVIQEIMPPHKEVEFSAEERTMSKEDADLIGGYTYKFEKGDEPGQVVVTERKVDSAKENAYKERKVARKKRIGEFREFQKPEVPPPKEGEPFHFPILKEAPKAAFPKEGKNFRLQAKLKIKELPTSLEDWEKLTGKKL